MQHMYYCKVSFFNKTFLYSTIFFTKFLIQGYFETISNLTGALYQINRFDFTAIRVFVITGSSRTTLSKKMNLYFTDKIRQIVQICSVRQWLCKRAQAITDGNNKINHCRLRFSDNAELGHFTCLFCKGRLSNVQRFIIHVNS